MEYYGVYDFNNRPETIRLFRHSAPQTVVPGEEGLTTVETDLSTNTVNVGITRPVASPESPVSVSATAGTYGPGVAASLSNDSIGVRGGVYRDPEGGYYGNIGVDKTLPNGATISADVFSPEQVVAGGVPQVYITYATTPLPGLPDGLAVSAHVGPGVVPQPNTMWSRPPPKPEEISGGMEGGLSVGGVF